MEPNRYTSPSPDQRTREWRLAYESVLQETETDKLFKCIEVAESAILTQRDSVVSSSDHHDERKRIEDALAHLRFIKTNRLGFGGMEDDDD